MRSIHVKSTTSINEMYQTLTERPDVKIFEGPSGSVWERDYRPGRSNARSHTNLSSGVVNSCIGIQTEFDQTMTEAIFINYKTPLN